MLELDLIGGDKVAPPAADWSWSLLNLQIAPEAPEMDWTHIHPSSPATEVTGSTDWTSADLLQSNNNHHHHHLHHHRQVQLYLTLYCFDEKLWKLTSSQGSKGERAGAPDEISPRSFEFFIHLVKTEKERKCSKVEAQLGTTNTFSAVFTFFF